MLNLGDTVVVVETPSFPMIEAPAPSITAGVVVPIPGAPGEDGVDGVDGTIEGLDLPDLKLLFENGLI